MLFFRSVFIVAIWFLCSAFFGPERVKHPLGEVVTFTSEPTDYELRLEKGKRIVHAKTGEKTASGLVILDAEKCLVDDKLNWRWMVLKMHNLVDIENKEKEDFAASVHLIYSDHQGADFYKNDFHMLSYVWAAQDTSIGSLLDAPAKRKGMQKRILLQNKHTPLQQWQVESRQVTNDLQQAFGEKPPYPLRAIMLFTDSDQTNEKAEAIYQMNCM